jgi:transglutaminase-like putative cysteine protease
MTGNGLGVTSGGGPTRRYQIEHRTLYSYSDDVGASYGRGFLRPRDLPWQRCLQHRVTTRPAAADSSMSLDVYGNTDFYFHVTRSHRELERFQPEARSLPSRSDCNPIEVSPAAI